MNGVSSLKWSSESQALESGITAILVTRAETEVARKSHKTSLT